MQSDKAAAARPSWAFLLAAIAFLATSATEASAQPANDPASTTSATEPPRTGDDPADAAERAPASLLGTPRPWLYATDPTAPRPGGVIASLGVGYAQVNRGAARPFAADVAHAGAVFSAGGEIGLARYASLHVEGLLANHGDGSPVGAGAMVGLSAFPLAGRVPFDLSVSAGYLRELEGANGIWARAAIAGDIGRTRLTLSALGEHVFSEGRDGVDILLTSGASIALHQYVRVGAEYVVQDLEGAWDPEEADGGIRHFIGPNVILLLGRGVQIAAGPALGLSTASPRLLGRLAATYAF